MRYDNLPESLLMQYICSTSEVCIYYRKQNRSINNNTNINSILIKFFFHVQHSNSQQVTV